MNEEDKKFIIECNEKKISFRKMVKLPELKGKGISPQMIKELLVSVGIIKNATLAQHRAGLKRIAPDNNELDRLVKNCKISGVPKNKNTKPILLSMTKSLLETQDNKPYFWVDVPNDPLPYSWNDPWDWDDDHIKYQWGHTVPINNGGTSTIENLALLSARCNNHIQTSLPLESLRRLFDGHLYGERIDYVQNKRKLLFESNEWLELRSKLDTYC
jgi:HNH endonuclease